MANELVMWAICDKRGICKMVDGTLELYATKKSAKAIIADFHDIGWAAGLRVEKVAVQLFKGESRG